MHHDLASGSTLLRVLILCAFAILPKHAERPSVSVEVDNPAADDAGKAASQGSARNPREDQQRPQREDAQKQPLKDQRESSTRRTVNSQDSEESCASIFADPRNWQVFPRIGRSLNWMATASVPAPKGTKNATDGVAKAFRDSVDVIQKVKAGAFTNVFLRPGADVILRPGLDLHKCPWTGELSLSTREDCKAEVDEREDDASGFARSYNDDGLLYIYRLALREQYLIAQFEDDRLELQAKDIQYFLCVKPTKQHAKPQAVHFFWYKRDADGQSVRTISATPFKDMLTNWVFKDSIVMDKPLSKELAFEDCKRKRWEDFDKGTTNDEVHTHAALRALHDDCSTLLPKPVKMPPHSAMLLCFQKRRHREGATTPDDGDDDIKNIAATPMVPGAVTIAIFLITSLARSREVST